MYITITSDFIRQLAFNKMTLKKLLNSYKEFYEYFQESIDNVLQIFGGNLNLRLETLIDSAKYLN